MRDILSRVTFFKDLSPEELDQVIAVGREVVYPKDMVFFKEGDRGEALYIVLEGSVKILKSVGDTAKEPMAFLERGSCFGDMALIDEFPRSATAIANQDCKVLFFDKQVLLDLLDRDPVITSKILWAFCRMLSLRLREASDRIVSLSSFVRPN